MRIGIVGAGAVGGLVGARLAEAGADVHLVARGAHLRALQADGLRLRGPDGEQEVAVSACADLAEVGPCDGVFVCVKSYDTAGVAAGLHGLLAPDGVVVSLQNGVGNEEILADAVGAKRVAGGVVYVFATLARPGVVDHHGPPRVVLGELDVSSRERVGRLVTALRSAGVEAEHSPRIRSVLWEKYAFICAVAGVTATTRLPMGAIRSSPAAWEMVARIIGEVLALARAEGVQVAPDAGERLLETAGGLDPGAHSSLHDDLVRGRRMELDALHGAAVRRAGRRDVPAPMCEAVHAILHPWWQQNEAKGGAAHEGRARA